MIAFTKNIESVIIENFSNAKKSITIIVAWFTNSKIIESLISIKNKSNIEIEILVDDNHINQKYFFEKHQENLLNAGILIKRQNIKKFNHNKFSIIDKKKIITGSYNYSIKANKNLENIIVFEDKNIASYYLRIFKFLTKEKYIDENVELLFENTVFANNLISTYYHFNRILFNKLKDKVKIGECYTYPNGLYDEIYYEPGIIFNQKYTLHKELVKTIEKKNKREFSFEDMDSSFNQEFNLPIDKELIKSHIITAISDFNHATLQETAHYDKSKIDYEQFGKDYEELELSVNKYYTRKFEKTFNKKKLKTILNKEIDIIEEDYIWINNFEPFLNDNIVLEIYKKL